MKARLFAILCVLISSAGAMAQAPFDTLQAAYRPFMNMKEPFGFAMKIKSVAGDRYTFWRGTKDLFFEWCKANAFDWQARPGDYVVSHGDLHLGNIGSYASAGGFGQLSFGEVDFDDSARLPFQIELLQGLITLQVIAAENHIELSSAQQSELLKRLLDSYGQAVNSQKSAAAFLADVPMVKDLLGKETAYSKEIDQYCDQNSFRPVVFGKGDKPKEVLRRADLDRDKLAAALAKALEESPAARERFRFHDAPSLRNAVKDVAYRTRLASSGSQGLKKIFILMDRPFVNIDLDIILYLKQQIPSAAERSGYIPRDQRSPGKRCAQDTLSLTSDAPFLNAWCEIGGESFLLTVKEPWSDELDFTTVRDQSKLVEAAHIWATVAGAAHGKSGKGEVIASQLTADFASVLQQRSDAYVKYLSQSYSEFRADTRVKSMETLTDTWINSVARH